jgi:hypothetical protein
MSATHLATCPSLFVYSRIVYLSAYLQLTRSAPFSSLLSLAG